VLAAGPPRAITGQPTEAYGGSAKFNGTVNGASEATSYWFEYRLVGASAIAGSTPGQQAAVSSEDQQVSCNSFQLHEGTTYEVRLVARNGDGTAYGEWVQFTTTQNAPKEVHPPLSLPGGTTPGSASPGSGSGPGGPGSQAGPSGKQTACRVPRVIGATLRAAGRRLVAARCRVGRIRYVRSSRVRKGRVIAQGERAGKKMAAGVKVSITVSRGRFR
jgi:hypothetical protein